MIPMQSSIDRSIAGLVGRVGRHTPQPGSSSTASGWAREAPQAAEARGLGRPFDFERAHAHSNDVPYQVSPPVTLIHTLPLLYPSLAVSL